MTLIAAVAALALPGAAAAHSMLPHHRPFNQMTLPQLAHYQQLTLQRDANAITWWQAYRHPRGSLTSATKLPVRHYPLCLGGRMPHEVCWHFKHRRWTTPLYRRTLARLQAVALPAHHALWMCIHGHEAADWQNGDTGGNGHYGGLQMHPGWGYGTSYYASSDSQATQERAAENGYAASGYSRAWLMGQWYHPDCLRYA